MTSRFMWYINVAVARFNEGDAEAWLATQDAWQVFCEDFMSRDIVIVRTTIGDVIQATCLTRLDPYQPMDSTGSMPSLISQSMDMGFKIARVSVHPYQASWLFGWE